ncbi:MAG TPA: ArsR family transcriptional regulator [Gammaproteobacteria bacterium]
MLEALLGSINKERVLVYLFVNDEDYARAIAQFFDTNLRNIQVQLDNLEAGGVLVSRLEGRTRLYGFNPRWPFRKELAALIERVLEFYPPEERERLSGGRRRPRRRGKPL